MQDELDSGAHDEKFFPTSKIPDTFFSENAALLAGLFSLFPLIHSLHFLSYKNRGELLGAVV